MKQTLEDTNDCSIWLVENGRSALELARKEDFSLALIDWELPDGTFYGLAKALQNLQPALRFVLIDDQQLVDEQIGWLGLPVIGRLQKDYSIAELLGVIKNIPGSQSTRSLTMTQHETGGSSGAAGNFQDEEIPLPWLQDVTRAAQYLARLSLSSAAHAALIVRAGELWAYAGQLSRTAALELAQAVAADWDGKRRPEERPPNGKSDLARFVRLESNDNEYMLYTTELEYGIVLALAFDTETPFSQIRAQADSLARALATPPEEQMNGGPAPRKRSPNDLVGTILPEDALPGAANHQPYGERVRPETTIVPLFPLDEVPAPTPRGNNSMRRDMDPGWPQGSRLAPGAQPDPDEKQTPVTERWHAMISGKQVRPMGELMPEDRGKSSEWETEIQDGSELQPGKRRIVRDFRALPENTMLQAAQDYARAQNLEAQSREFTPVSPGLSRLSYCSILIPRMPQHYLIGDLSARLGEWVGQLCIAFGWRLEHLAVRPLYLLWITSMPPNVTASYMIHAVRQQTSKRLFATFTQLGDENPSEDFWAPGFLVVSSFQPLPSRVVQEFIRHIRKRQGIVWRV